MPEGPEIRRTAESLADVLLGETVLDFAATARRWRRSPWAERIIGQPVTAIDTHGKNILIHIGQDIVLYSHLMMWGRWRTFPPDADVPDDRRVRAWLRTRRGLAVLYNGPVFEIMSPQEAAHHTRLTTLGPDVLAEPFDRAEFLARLAHPDAGQLELGEALLEQRLAAGVGNYLKSEILFTAGLNPYRCVGSLTEAERERLARHIPRLARRAYVTGGMTVSPGLARVWRAAGGNWYDYHHYVYRRSKRACRRCGALIQGKRQGQHNRLTYWCPGCQC